MNSATSPTESSSAFSYTAPKIDHNCHAQWINAVDTSIWSAMGKLLFFGDVQGGQPQISFKSSFLLFF